MTRRGVKISNFVLFLRVAEGVDPYINEVCANIVRSTVGRRVISRRFLGIRLLKASPRGRGGAVRRRRGAKKYQISLFFRTVEDACPYNNKVLLSIVEPAMCVKNFPLEVFWRYLFFKKGSKIKPKR